MVPRRYAPLGWLLLLPALLGALLTLAAPSAHTVYLSTQEGNFLRDGRFAGMDNYAALLGDSAFWRALGFSLAMSVIPLLVAVLVAPVLALALAAGGTWVRRAGRIMLSLAIVTFSPVALAGAWGISLVEGLRGEATSSGTLVLIVAAATFGLICALGVTAYLPALRGDTPVPATLTVGALVLLTVFAVGLQSFSFTYLLGRHGPKSGSRSLLSLAVEEGFVYGRIGVGAAATTLLGLLLGLAGLAAVILAILTRLRADLSPRPARSLGACR